MSQPLTPAAYEQAGTYTAVADRQYLVTSPYLKDPADASRAKGGLLPDVETRRAPGSVATWTVTIGPYRAVVPNLQAANQGDYLVVATANDTAVVAASSPTLNRIDLIAVRVRDAAFAGADSDAELVVIAGTPAAGAAGVPAIPSGASYLVLYEANILANSTAATLIDRRRSTAASGAVPLVYPHEVALSGSYPGEMQLVPGISGAPPYLRYWDGAAWTTYSPTPITDKFTAGGTWTKRAGVKYVRVRVQAGGGAGGGCAATGAGDGAVGGGGEAGAYSESFFAASSLGATVAVTVGAGGTAVTNGTGNTGGTSSFGAHVSATGGAGGSAGAAGATASVAAGGSSTQTMVGNLQIPGQAGLHGSRSGQSFGSLGGTGGNAQLGHGSPPPPGSANGLPGRLYGGGGSGATNNTGLGSRSGGAGAAGIVMIDNYF